MEGKADHDRIIELMTRLEEYRAANESRMTKLNELREEVTNDREEFLRKDVYNTRNSEINNALKSLGDRLAVIEARLSVLVGVGLVVVAVASVIGALVGRSFK